MRRERWIGAAVVACSLLVTATCLRSDSELCGDGRSRCAEGTRCVALSPEVYGCAGGDQVAACEASTDGTCTLDGLPGQCIEGACFVYVCGNGVVEGPEACDDGNTADDDGCSATCLSNETCGNGVIDLVRSEQCDDGIAGLSGDGCTSKCLLEYSAWRDVWPGAPAPRGGHIVVPGPDGGLLMLGGTSSQLGAPLLSGSASESASFDDMWRWRGENWERVHPPTAPPRRVLAAADLDPLRRRVVMFGGFNAAASHTKSTWEWDGVTWIERTPPSTPSARAAAGMACRPGRCFLFGGTVGLGSGSGAGSGSPVSLDVRNDLWAWDGVTWTEVSTPTRPPARAAPVFVYDAQRDRFVMYGGRAGDASRLRDTWELQGTTAMSWTNTHTGSGSAAPPAHPTTGTFDPATGSVYVVADVPQGSDETWRYATATATWSPAVASGPDIAVASPVLARDPMRPPGQDRLTLTPGLAVFELDTAANTWQPHAPLPSPAWSDGVAAVFDAERGRTLVVVVVPGSTTASGTWAWDGAGWRRLASPGQGVPLQRTALAFDRGCDQALMFGGTSNLSTSPSDKLWALEGNQWVEVVLSGPIPPARYDHAMTYDRARDAVVVFGGRGTNGTVLDGSLWELRKTGCDDGQSTWVEHATPGPAPRFTTALAYDPGSQRVVLFGGAGASGLLGDTWEWDGTAWAEASPAAAPSPRSGHAMTYDERRRRIILFGGATAQGAVDEVWEWDGTAKTWRSIAVATPIEGRSGMALAQDVSGGLIAIGGRSTSGQLFGASQLRLRSELALGLRERCVDGAGDDDQDGLEGCADPDCRFRCAPLCSIDTPFATCSGPRCGDGMCSEVEDFRLCPHDCLPPPP